MELRASLEVVDSPNARLELARTLRDSDHLSEAWAEYGRVVDAATKLAAKEERYAKTGEAATAERAVLAPKLAFVTVTVVNAPADATLRAAGRSVSKDLWASPIVVPAGAVDVVLSDAGAKELARQTVSTTVGEKTAVVLDAQPAPLPKPAVLEAGGQPDSSQARADTGTPAAGDTKLRPYAYVVGGIGVAGLALFGVFGLMDNATYGDLQSSCPHNVCPAGKQGELDAGRAQQTVANVSLVLGSLGVAAGATLFVLSLSPRSSTSTGLVVAPGYVGWRGSL